MSDKLTRDKASDVKLTPLHGCDELRHNPEPSFVSNVKKLSYLIAERPGKMSQQLNRFSRMA